ncbi:putative quinol monooxygenase [Jiulongibacter sediminis]|nr:putative quinol monooxygenase [Jiulongibacter sediminis]
MKKLYLILITAIPLISFGQDNLQNQQHIPDNMMIRLVEIEIEPEYLDEYLNILKEESNASMKLEPGVISIYPMYQKDNPTEIRLLEIYANQKAYESHLETPHFKYYKTTTLKMVKSLKLVDMNAIDPDAMPMIFKKIR